MDSILNAFNSRTWSQRVVWLLVLAALVLGFGSRLWLARTKPNLEHDEAISMMEASGTMDEVGKIWADKVPPYMTPTPAATWQQFMKPEGNFIFGEVADGANTLDRQPPFYYWALHVWLVLFGTSLFSAVSLNLVLDVLTAVVLYRFAREFFTRPYASLVVIVWLLSPVAMYTALFIRSYSFLALASVCFAYASYVTFYKAGPYRRLHGVLFVAATVLLIGIHYYAVWLIGAAGLAAAIHWLRREPKRVLLMIGHLLAALVVMVVIQPSYFAPILRNDTSFPFDLPTQLNEIVVYSLSFVFDLPYQRGSFLFMRPLLVVVFVVIPVVVYIVQRARGNKDSDTQPPGGQYIAILAVVAYGSIVGMYLAGITPLHYRYFSYAVLLAGFLLVFFLHLTTLKRNRTVLGLAVGAIMLLSGVLTTREINAFNRRIGNLTRVPDGSELVLINIGADNHTGAKQVSSRGHALQVVYNLPPQTVVMIGHLDAFLSETGVWLPEIAAHKTTLLLGFPNDELFSLIAAQGYALESFPSYLYYTDTRRITNDKVANATSPPGS